MPAATVKFYIDITIGRSGQKWDFRLNFRLRGPIDTRSTCLNCILHPIWTLNIFGTPKYAPQISYLAYLGADFFVDFSNISSRIIKKKKLGLHTYYYPFVIIHDEWFRDCVPR